MKEAMEKCDASHKCSSGKDFSACLQVSGNAIGSFAIIKKNEGQKKIDITLKEPSNIKKNKPLKKTNGAFGQKYISPYSWNITLKDGNEDCCIHVRKSVERQSKKNLQQKKKMFAAYAARLNQKNGASQKNFTVVLVGIVCAKKKFAKKKGNDGVPYQQLEKKTQAPKKTVVDNTTSTTDEKKDGWEKNWDDEEAPAKPSDKKPTSSASANGLSLRSQTKKKDGWKKNWDD
ncbi:hypothetical protein BAE44_0020746 [Dichanthelium oligosanthes]|uniref:DUF7356 domain-containing protein n=1 Tax=Dichanthelium oligosanthes TaxID=888268 RepID=A0A1E5UZG5_9POAL|nr:hypothetical protein BAE44_0020746 [Dichanthelium oligosanthes]